MCYFKEVKTMLEIKYVRCDDWKGLYVNNKLNMEGHSLLLFDIMKMLKDCVENALYTFYYNEYYVDDNWMEDQGSYPLVFTDIPEEYRKRTGGF